MAWVSLLPGTGRCRVLTESPAAVGCLPLDFFSYALLHVPLVHAGKRTLFQNILPVRPLSLALPLCEMGILLTDGAATRTRQGCPDLHTVPGTWPVKLCSACPIPLIVLTDDISHLIKMSQALDSAF